MNTSTVSSLKDQINSAQLWRSCFLKVAEKAEREMLVEPVAERLAALLQHREEQMMQAVEMELAILDLEAKLEWEMV